MSGTQDPSSLCFPYFSMWLPPHGAKCLLELQPLHPHSTKRVREKRLRKLCLLLLRKASQKSHTTFRPHCPLRPHCPDVVMRTHLATREAGQQSFIYKLSVKQALCSMKGFVATKEERMDIQQPLSSLCRFSLTLNVLLSRTMAVIPRGLYHREWGLGISIQSQELKLLELSRLG